MRGISLKFFAKRLRVASFSCFESLCRNLLVITYGVKVIIRRKIDWKACKGLISKGFNNTILLCPAGLHRMNDWLYYNIVFIIVFTCYWINFFDNCTNIKQFYNLWCILIKRNRFWSCSRIQEKVPLKVIYSKQFKLSKVADI